MEEKAADNRKSGVGLKDVYSILETATEGMSGIQAICTADAIICLWQWENPEDLKRAKAAIDYLLKKMEETR